MRATPQEIESIFNVSSATSRKSERGERLVSVYFDTADQTLRHHCVSLRVRRHARAVAHSQPA